VAYEQQAAIAAAYIASTVELRASLLDAIVELFRRLTSWRDADADRFVAAAVPMVAGAQQAMARITDSYIAAMLSDLLGEDVEPLGFSLDEELRGVAPEEVYRRPFTQIWTELSEGSLLRDAVKVGERRAEGLAATDLELAKTHASREALEGHEDERIAGYRRVLTGAENCAMCVLASTQRYHIADLLPIHPACDCGVAPIVGDDDPGQTINSVIVTEGVQALRTNEHGVKVYAGDQLTDLGELLEPLHEEIEKRFGRSDRGGRALDYRKVLTVHQHGEIGPVLAIKGQHFAGPGQIHTH
jgi:hypothetical protein